MDLVSSISASLDIVKKLRELDRKVGEADFKMLLADLTSELGDAKLNAANLKIELAEAKDRIEELERQVAQRASAEPELHEGGYIFGDTARHYCILDATIGADRKFCSPNARVHSWCLGSGNARNAKSILALHRAERPAHPKTSSSHLDAI